MRRFIPFLKTAPRVAVVQLHGVISAARGPYLSDAALAPLLDRAFRRGRPKAVALVINSPGGSPAQSSLIAARIRRLSEEREVPVYAFVEDVAASGGYWLATAADEIWADGSSILGSIGVISAGFGFHDFIERHGVERRIHTSGGSKSMLDPFRPEKEEDVARLERLQTQIHESFIAQVRTRRGARLATREELFTGDIWVGEAAREVGLIDGIGHLVPTMRARFGKEVRFVSYKRRRGLSVQLGSQLAAGAWSTVEERVALARFGL